MKIESMPGEFFYRALVYNIDMGGYNGYWKLSTQYFKSKKEAIFCFGHDQVEWPVDEIDHGVLYIPSEGELQ